MADAAERVVLEGQDAIDLWQRGRDAWNTWVEENPEADIDFSGVDFSKYGDVSFASFRFPNGKKDFSETVFDDGIVGFYEADFGDGDVRFRGATFIASYVSFDGTRFGKGFVSFYRTTFEDCDLGFNNATFDSGIISFNHADFGKSRISFGGTKFGNGAVSFYGATFGGGFVSFDSATFGDGPVNFVGAAFGACNVAFEGGRFGKGGINFNHIDLEKGSLTFNAVKFGENDISFKDAKVNGNLELQCYENTKFIRGLSFHGMRLTGTFYLEGDFTCVPDLRSTALSAHVDLENLRIEASPHELKSPEDDKYAKGDPNIARLRRLKELAEQNRHHEAALHFLAMERRVARHAKAMSPGAAVLDYIYELVCDYGQSI